MRARERFEQTRQAVSRLAEVQALIMYDCDDWHPESVHAAHELSDPTAARAIKAVDELADKLEALRAEEREMLQFIGDSLAIISAVKQGFGEIYANLLEWRYIDGWTFTRIHEERGIPRSTCYYLVDIAFDWIDSVGVSRLLRGQTDV